jgi:hypothetical protein
VSTGSGSSDDDLSRLAERLLAGQVRPGLLDTAPKVRLAGPERIGADEESVEKGLAQLVMTVVELLRELMERQALRRVEGGRLTDEEVERLGTTLMLLEKRMEELRETFGLEASDLNLDLGPLGRLL